MSQPATVVLVERQPWGTTHHIDCVADVFTPDVLTITCPDLDGREIAVYQPRQWKSATVLDAHGYVLYAHINQQKERVS